MKLTHAFNTFTKCSQNVTTSDPMIRTRMFAYQGIKNVSFSKKFAYVLNG